MSYNVCLTNKPKQAALFFDEIVPLSLSFEEVMQSKFTLGQDANAFSRRMDELESAGIRDLLPDVLRDGQGRKNARELEVFYALISICKLAEDRGLDPSELGPGVNVDKAVERFLISFFDLNKKLNGKFITDFEPFQKFQANNSVDCALVSVSGVPIVETSNLTWEHIFEFRKDIDSKSALRRFRLFAIEEYTGKDASFIEDDLYLRMNAYEEAVKKHGFDMVAGSIDTVLSARDAQASGVAAIAALAAGLGPIVVLAAAAPLVCKLGQVGISVARAKRDVIAIKAEHPASYLVEARARLK